MYRPLLLKLKIIDCTSYDSKWDNINSCKHTNHAFFTLPSLPDWKEDLLDPGNDLEKSLPSWYTSTSSCSDCDDPLLEPAIHAWSGCSKLVHSPMLSMSSETKFTYPLNQRNYLFSLNEESGLRIQGEKENKRNH